MLTHWRYIGNISPRYFPDFFLWFFPIFSRYLPILSRYLPIFGDICRFFQIYCDFFLFLYFLIFLYFLFCRCLPTFLPINPIISFWTLGDIFADTIFVTLRFVARGFSHKEGVDYDETFAPVAWHTSIRTIIGIASVMGWKLHQMDVKTAFLNGVTRKKFILNNQMGLLSMGRSPTSAS